nr:Asp-tRNA(Asn)/Glu-tRNA(Gln) amidotransferase subunit GatA [Bacilli bacterium]
VLSCAEATSNNANLDGIKFGPYYHGKTYEEVMSNARTKGFSELIKRRFVFGSFALMSENQHDLFLRAQRNRRRIVEATNAILDKYDAIYLPAAPSVAPKKDEKSNRLSNEYLIADNHLVIGNFAGLPSLTLPIGFKDGLPFGANVSSKPFDEETMFAISAAIERNSGLKGIYAKGEEK